MIVSELIQDIVKEHYAYIANCECEATERKKQIAAISMQTKLLQANSEIAKKYFEQQMEERNRLFVSANKVLETAMERGDYEFAQIAVIALEVIHKKSPFSSEL